ncbi:MAG: hypothetical protein P8N40_07495 [Gammaproteobacteria bacterium]|nr:hypothetical protein [Gammaproteobacteria bacterium]
MYLIRIALFVLFTQAVNVFAQLGGDFTTPLNEWGHPDLNGVWNFSSNTPMQRPEKWGDQEFLTPKQIREEIDRQQAAAKAADERAARAVDLDAELPTGPQVLGYNDFWFETEGLETNMRTSHIVYPLDGRIPDAVEGAKVQRGNQITDTPNEIRPVRFVVGGISKDGPEDRGLSERCIVGFNSGPPFVPSLYNNNVQLVQNENNIVILTEMIHDARIVPIGEKPTLDDNIRLWSGDSRGYWDGDTLIVETKNFNGYRQTFNSTGDNYDMLLTEKFTRTAFDQVVYEFTINDPTTFTDKISAVVPMTKTSGQLYEYACHEGNYGMPNTLRGARVAEKNDWDLEGR